MPDHNKAIQLAGRTHLKPIGCTQKGRSRTWLDDNSWWVGVVEFQPSSWSKGSYLNVGVCWLWNAKDYYSFDHGGRVSLFKKVPHTGDFEDIASQIAVQAKSIVLEQREQFETLEKTAEYLKHKEILEHDIWGNFHAGVACGWTGDIITAEQYFENVLSSTDDRDWALSLKAKTLELSNQLKNSLNFHHLVMESVKEARHILKLPELSGNV